MKLSIYSIVYLLLILHTHCNGVFGLYKITEDAISIGREIFNEVEHTEQGRINATEVAIKKFHDKYYNPSPPDLYDYSWTISQLFDEWDNKEFLQNFRKNEDLAFLVPWLPTTLTDLIEADRYFVPSYTHSYSDSFETQLSELHKFLLTKGNDTGDSIFDAIMKKKEESKCRSKIMSTLLYFLNYITVADAFGYIIMQHEYAAVKVYKEKYTNPNKTRYLTDKGKSWFEKNLTKTMKDFEDAFIKRNTETLRLFKDAIALVPRESWFCNDYTILKRYITDDRPTYTKLDNLFQLYIINEVDLNEDGKCTRECGDYQKTKMYGCYDKGICARQRFCDGTLWGCDTRIESPMTVCLADDDSNIRYKVIYADGKKYGDASKCNSEVSVKSWSRGFVKCTYCTCTCDERNKAGDRYFNLRPTLSDVQSNHVVVNAKFTKVNNVVHIEIQEAQLLSEGRINGNSIKEKHVDNYTVYDQSVKEGKDYHTITYDQRTVLIDEIDSPPNYALTGLRFTTDEGNLKLEIHVTPFNFTTGKLNAGGSRWMSSDTKFSDRSEEKFENKNDVNSKPHRFLRFTTSNIKIDAGQTTIPYVENLDVIHLFEPAVLSGAGLITKSEKDEGSMLGLKLFTYDYVHNLPI